MKTLVTLITICFLSTISFGQKNLFYASTDDYIAGKPIPGYEIVDGSYSNGTFGVTFKVKNGDQTTKIKLSELPSEFFSYASIYTYPKYIDCFMRSYKGDVYMVIVNGPICLYSYFQFPERQYYSESITGKLKKYDRNVIEKFCKEYNLYDSYKNDHPKLKASTTAEERINNNLQHDAKYFELINKKIKG